MTETEPTPQQKERTGLQLNRRVWIAARRHATPVFATGILPLAALAAALIALLASLVLPPGLDLPAPKPPRRTPPTLVVHTRPSLKHQAGVRGRRPAPDRPNRTPLLTSSDSSPASGRLPEPEPGASAPAPGPTSPPPPQPTAPPATPPTIPDTAEQTPSSPPPSTAPAPAPSAPPPSTAPAAPPPTQSSAQTVAPGWGCGDENHQHTGPPGKADGDSPCGTGGSHP